MPKYDELTEERELYASIFAKEVGSTPSQHVNKVRVAYYTILFPTQLMRLSMS